MKSKQNITLFKKLTLFIKELKNHKPLKIAHTFTFISNIISNHKLYICLHYRWIFLKHFCNYYTKTLQIFSFLYIKNTNLFVKELVNPSYRIYTKRKLWWGMCWDFWDLWKCHKNKYVNKNVHIDETKMLPKFINFILNYYSKVYIFYYSKILANFFCITKQKEGKQKETMSVEEYRGLKIQLLLALASFSSWTCWHSHTDVSWRHSLLMVGYVFEWNRKLCAVWANLYLL